MERVQQRIFLAVALIGIVSCASALAVLEFNLRFPSEGRMLTKVTARSGSVSDIQAAVDEAVSKGLLQVQIPEGTFVFNASGSYRVTILVPESGLDIVGAGINNTVLDLPDSDTASHTSMFEIVGGAVVDGMWLSGGKIRITGITFRGRARDSSTGDTAIQIVSCKDFRVDHCSFYDMGSSGISVGDQATQYGIQGGDPARISQGVIDHNEFYDIYKSATHQARNGYGYGVALSRAMHYLWISWDDNIWNFLGKYGGNVFIEDNYFRGTRHAVADIGGGVYVFRHNVLEDQIYTEAALTGHPVRENIYGMRAWEVYNNVFRYTGTYGVRYYGPLCKGGGGIVFNNTMENLRTVFILGNCEHYNEVFYPKGNVKDLYVWNNANIGCTQGLWHQSPYSDGTWTAPVAEEGTDWFSDMTGIYSTQQVQDMVTANGYDPYPYPHPLTQGQTPP